MANKNLKLNKKIIKRPITGIKTKAVKCLINNQYSFLTNRYANKISIKAAIESFYSVKVIKINTITLPRKKKRVGKHFGWKPRYKKAIVTLEEKVNPSLFSKINKE